jgi:hypothetical protein
VVSYGRGWLAGLTHNTEGGSVPDETGGRYGEQPSRAARFIRVNAGTSTPSKVASSATQWGLTVARQLLPTSQWAPACNPKAYDVDDVAFGVTFLTCIELGLRDD